MAGKYQIIARYTEGVPKFWIGRKIDPDKPLNEENVEWKIKDGVPLRYDQFRDAEDVIMRKCS